MNSNCEKIRDQIADLITGALSELQVRALEAHLHECSACRFYARALREEDDFLTEFFTEIETNMTGREEHVLKAISRSFVSEQSDKISIGRTIMKSPIRKLAAAAVIIIGVALSITVVNKLTSEAYAIVQTVEALKDVRFLHLVSYDENGQVQDERWIEIGMDGRQIRYRQDTPPDFLVVEDGNSTAAYYKDKHAVVLYDRKYKQYVWVSDLGEFFENLRQKGTILEQNTNYRDRAAHKLLRPMANAEVYVDPVTKLPFAIGNTELSYEQPPQGTFEIIIPEGFAILDRRPGAEPIEEPDWLKREDSADELFNKARHALAAGNYAEAAALFEYVIDKQSPGRNWAWFWLGSAYYELGEYDLAIEKFSNVIDILSSYGPVPYCLYARGLAYASKGQHNPAEQDLVKVLPWMIQSLRQPTAAEMFEYAEDPLLRSGGKRPTEQQIIARMINRLRIITGQNFGYDPGGNTEENEQAIAAWEEWFKNSGKIKVTPYAELVRSEAIADNRFNQAAHALADGNYAKAAELFEYVVEHQSGRNWAWFWLGSAYYGQGQYELAIEKFTKVLEMFKAHGGGGDQPLIYCNYARGLAYAQIGMDEAAAKDLQPCLPAMVSTLREPSAAEMFEYADNPLLRYGKYRPSEQQIVTNMINRLRIISGQNFGYDPYGTAEENEQAITAWEEWFKNSGEINVTPDAELVAIPEIAEETVK